MNRQIKALVACAGALCFTACTPEPSLPPNYDPQADLALEDAINQSDPSLRMEDYILPLSTDLHSIPQDPKNPLTPEKVRLGRWLYHETGLARDPKQETSMLTYSCASCHHAAGGFQANRRQGIGDGGLGFGISGERRRRNSNYLAEELDVQPIRTPSALNVAYQRVMLWNGQFGATGPNTGTEARWTDGTPIATNHLGYQGVEIQAIAGLGVHRLVVTKDIVTELGYLDEFNTVFANFPEPERYTLETAGLAIAAYERTLVPRLAPFQRWLRGEREAMTDRQKEGAVVFFEKGECASCHRGPALNSEAFFALAMPDLLGDEIFNSPPDAGAHLGRGGFTGNEEELYAFKVPQLYNLKDSPFLGHGGTFQSVREMVQYKNNGIPLNPNVPQERLAADFHPLNLSQAEVDALVDFLENGLYDPWLSRFEPQQLPSSNCFPNADMSSKFDMGCQ